MRITNALKAIVLLFVLVFGMSASAYAQCGGMRRGHGRMRMRHHGHHRRHHHRR